ncbi:MAG: SMP-30/gluconolactonase/LRE family protein [Egibacteraceae bacterium]
MRPVPRAVADNSTLIVAESHAQRLSAFDIDADGNLPNRRVWADLDVLEGGEILQSIHLDHGCFACMLGGPDDTTLFMVAAKGEARQHVRRTEHERGHAVGLRR